MALHVTVAHVLPHRVRLRARVLADRRDACAHVAAALASSDRLEKVTARPVTGSVIVEDEERTLDARALAARLSELLGAERDEEGRPLAAIEAQEHPGPTRIARAVAHAVAGINADIRAALDDHADLGTLLPLVFAAAGIADVARTRKLPVPTWFNLLWWSLRSFMTFNIRAVEEEVLDGRSPRPHDFTSAV
jgi:hypothetical protein